MLLKDKILSCLKVEIKQITTENVRIMTLDVEHNGKTHDKHDVKTYNKAPAHLGNSSLRLDGFRTTENGIKKLNNHF